MNEIATNDFDYSLVGTETAHKLKALSNQLDGIYQNYSVAVGEVLFKAQQELSNYGTGTFGRWVESNKISKVMLTTISMLTSLSNSWTNQKKKKSSLNNHNV